MASTKPSLARSRRTPAAKSAKQSAARVAAKRIPAASVTAAGVEAKGRLAAAKGMPGWGGVRQALGEALAAGDSALLLELRGQAVSLRRRVGDAWQPPGMLAVDTAAAVFTAFAKLAMEADAREEPGFLVTARKTPRHACRVEARKTERGEQLVVLLSPDHQPAERPRVGRLISAALGRLLALVRRRSPKPLDFDPTVPVVDIEATGPDAVERTAAVAETEGYGLTCDLIAAAMKERANAIIIKGGASGVSVQFDVDGVRNDAPQLDAAEVGAVVATLRAIGGGDPKSRGTHRSGIIAKVQGNTWPCTVTTQRGSSGERVMVAIDPLHPTFKKLVDTGMADTDASQVQELLKAPSGLILVVAPPAGGLSTMLRGVVEAADRLLREWVILEDEAAPWPEIKHVKPCRWDSRVGGKPAGVIETATRQYPDVIVTCDLEDAELAQWLVARAADKKLVIVGIRGADAADGVARLMSLGVDRHPLARALLGAVGTRLVRKLCTKCRYEYLPAVAALTKFSVDPDVEITFFRAAAAGCAVCTGTGYLGRTAVCEVAAGPWLRPGLEKTADAAVLRREAAKGGMVTIVRDAIAKAARGTTSLEEIQRVFRKA